ncbi:MAG: SIMPL domain-containing protein, partial [Microbacteriaceae bacterium]|nr:SIMPL domain-containing protein [Microbacteriaceae bacterium]
RPAAAARAAAAADAVRERLAALEGQPGLARWSSSRVRTGTRQRWQDGREIDPMHYVEQDFSARWTDSAALGAFVGELAAHEDVAVQWVSWGLLPETYRRVEQDVAQAAIEAAVSRATAYARAIGRTRVVPEQIADLGLLEEQARPQAKALRGAAFAMAAPPMDAGGGVEVDLSPAPQTVSASVEARFLAS